MNNNKIQPGGLEYDPGTAPAAGPQRYRAIIRPATLPGQDAAGDTLNTPGGPQSGNTGQDAAALDLPDYVKSLQNIATRKQDTNDFIINLIQDITNPGRNKYGHKRKTAKPGTAPAVGPQYESFKSPIYKEDIIKELFNILPGCFAPNYSQFKALFGKPIEMPAPIETTPGIAAAILETFETAGIIKAKKYAKVAEYSKCFTWNGQPITARQLRDAKEANKMSPLIGNYQEGFIKIIELGKKYFPPGE